MKSLFSFLLIAFFSCPVMAQHQVVKEALPDSTKKLMLVEAACGQCKFHMAGKGCNLAVRIEGKSYFVDGTSIDEHGDAHAKDGFCEAIRKAKVQGEIVNNRFKSTYFKLITPDNINESKTRKEE